MSTELSNVQKIEQSIQNMVEKKNKIMFFVPDIKVPAGSLYEIYFHATLMKQQGYKVIILTENDKFGKPDFIEPQLTDHEHIATDKSTLTVSPEDLLIIPEIFTNVMELTKNLPCNRAVLFQSVDNATSALLPGYDWSRFGIKNVITTSKKLELFITQFFGQNKFNVFTYNVNVPDYFVNNKELKRPVISILVRNERDLDKVVKLFYTAFPQYSWVNFEPLLTDSKPPKFLRRKDFAEKLSKNFAALWLDRISSHAQFPLECFKVGTIPISLLPEITPDYIMKDGKYIDNAGVWSDDIYQIPALIGNVVRQFLDDEIDESIYKVMADIAADYSPEVSKGQLLEIYGKLLDEQKGALEIKLNAFKAASEAAPAQ